MLRTNTRSTSNETERYNSRESEASQTRESTPKQPTFFDSPVPGGESREGLGSHYQKRRRIVVAVRKSDIYLPSPRRLRGKFPEFEIGSLLIEVYFSRMWTASLLFDYRSIVEAYRAATIPEHILLSIFAVASL